jgi:hypothetical protein
MEAVRQEAGGVLSVPFALNDDAFYDFENTFPMSFANSPGIAIVGNSINFNIFTFRSLITSIESCICSSAIFDCLSALRS